MCLLRNGLTDQQVLDLLSLTHVINALRELFRSNRATRLMLNDISVHDNDRTGEFYPGTHWDVLDVIGEACEKTRDEALEVARGFIPDDPFHVELSAPNGVKAFREKHGAFPLELLPDVISEPAKWVRDNYGVPAEIPALLAMAAIGACCGKGLMLKSITDASVRPNLFVIIGAPSGAGKTLVAKRFLLPLEEFDQERSQGGSGSRLITADTTSEALIGCLERNHGVIASFSTEGRAALKTLLGAYQHGRTDEKTLIAGFSGDNIREDRVTRQGGHVESPCVSLVWLAQTDIYERALKNDELRGSGFLPRTLALDFPKNQRPKTSAASAAANIVFEPYSNRCKELFRSFYTIGPNGPVTLDPTPEARAALEEFDEHANEFFELYCDEGIAALMSRAAELAWHIALIIHAAKFGSTSIEHSVDLNTANAAIAVMWWYGFQVEKRYAAVKEASTSELADKILDFISRAPNGVTGREVNRKFQTRRMADIQPILDELESEGILRLLERRYHCVRMDRPKR